MKKKGIISAGIVAVICILALMFTTIMASANPFKDVPEGKWYYDSVMYANDNGLMKGLADDQFGPEETMSRAMIVTVLHRMEGVPSAPASQFKDVPAGKWFTDAVAWAADNGIVNGKSSDEFDPNGDVTREQIAAILYRYAGSKGYDVSQQADLTGFSDYSKISKYAREALSWANANELVKGMGENQLAPGDNATRAQVATIFMRFCENIAKTSGGEDEVTHTVTLDYNYDNKGTFKTLKIKDGESAGQLEQPSRDGFDFSGWFTETVDGKEYSGSETVTKDITLYAHWTEKQEALPMPDNPTEADTYYWENSEKVLAVEDVAESDDVLTEDEANTLLEDRGLADYGVTYEYSMEGEYNEETEAEDGVSVKHPMYQSIYVTEEGNAWSIYVVDGSVFALPIFYNLESTLESELIISESDTLTSYDDETNKFYVTVPDSSGAIVKKVDRIDKETLDRLTIEEIDRL